MSISIAIELSSIVCSLLVSTAKRLLSSVSQGIVESNSLSSAKGEDSNKLSVSFDLFNEHEKGSGSGMSKKK